MQSEDLTGTIVAGYHLLERVGEGGTATVYRAQHAERGVCAVKILRAKLRGDRTAVQRFLREAEYGSRVAHPAVVQTYGQRLYSFNASFVIPTTGRCAKCANGSLVMPMEC